jgi:ferredoxin-NADP reductase
MNLDSEKELLTTVAHKETLADGVVRLTLRTADGADFPLWSPGAHIDVSLPGGIIRQYSLCGERADRSQVQVAILNEPKSRGGSKYIHESLEEGADLWIRGPRNHFEFVSAPTVIFIAGGIGITPIIPMLAQAQQLGVDWHLYYGGRTEKSMAFTDELVATYGERVTLWPEDQKGLIDLPAILGTPAERTKIYACGPGPLLNAVEERAKPWPARTLYTERFVAKDLGSVTNGAFEIELTLAGRTLTVPADKTILETIEDAGISVLSSCQEGTCGTCETTIVEGEADHRDSLLTDEEKESNESLFICVSRAKSARLVLEI